MDTNAWIKCPVCNNKTRVQMRPDTELKNFPLFCPKCKQESLIEVKNLQVTVINDNQAKTVIHHK
ncbi:MAG: cysteine-rich KTR domain-containing protein [Clostridia bacterium]|nr:cysteine-rich KTR domain-containing protein [Clostridia bacterium]